ncbi:hypothetical protein FM119_11185 [Mycetocola reblochoni REB411]|uniref:Uncharacterized protein n=1 Tax=Mycetocola reblochoni REB411 TaxID=1255698 RepID=A0A1R4K416_9MICO|nr:hypothetical protein FM119_11185 [Mycetocola reblochoni REB411]
MDVRAERDAGSCLGRRGGETAIGRGGIPDGERPRHQAPGVDQAGDMARR